MPYDDDAGRFWADLAAGRGGVADVALAGLDRIERALRSRAEPVLSGPLPVELSAAFIEVADVARLLRTKIEGAARRVQSERQRRDVARSPLTIARLDRPMPTLTDPLRSTGDPGETVFTVHAGEPFGVQLATGLVVTVEASEDGVYALRGARLLPRPPPK